MFKMLNKDNSAEFTQEGLNGGFMSVKMQFILC